MQIYHQRQGKFLCHVGRNKQNFYVFSNFYIRLDSEKYAEYSEYVAFEGLNKEKMYKKLLKWINPRVVAC